MTETQFINCSKEEHSATKRTCSTVGSCEGKKDVTSGDMMGKSEWGLKSSDSSQKKIPSASPGICSSESIELRTPVMVKMDSAFALIDYPGYGRSADCAPTPQGTGLLHKAKFGQLGGSRACHL